MSIIFLQMFWNILHVNCPRKDYLTRLPTNHQPNISLQINTYICLFRSGIYCKVYEEEEEKQKRTQSQRMSTPQFWRRGLVQNSCQLSHQAQATIVTMLKPLSHHAQALPFSVTQKQRAPACRLLTHLLLVSIINLQPQLCPLKMCQVIHSVDSGWTRLQTWRFLQHFRISIFRYVCVTLILVSFQSK